VFDAQIVEIHWYRAPEGVRNKAHGFRSILTGLFRIWPIYRFANNITESVPRFSPYFSSHSGDILSMAEFFDPTATAGIEGDSGDNCKKDSDAYFGSGSAGAEPAPLGPRGAVPNEALRAIYTLEICTSTNINSNIDPSMKLF
jgi:hypothetical protein